MEGGKRIHGRPRGRGCEVPDYHTIHRVIIPPGTPGPFPSLYSHALTSPQEGRDIASARPRLCRSREGGRERGVVRRVYSPSSNLTGISGDGCIRKLCVWLAYTTLPIRSSTGGWGGIRVLPVGLMCVVCLCGV